MQKKVMASFALLICLFSILPAATPQTNAETSADLGFDVELSANAVYFMNMDTGIVIYSKNADAQVHPASTTKIMSAALAMELCDDLDNTIVTVPEDVWSSFNGLVVSNAGLKVGEELTMNELIHCMMLQSANEAAVTVAEYYGYDAFIKMMNDKAAELGCTNTHFTNPHGAFVQDHYTSAHDMALITAWAMSVPGFWDISQKARYDKRETNKNEAVTLTTTILMQDSANRYYTPYIKGIKTGTLDEAGRCLVSAAQQDGVTYMLVILGAPLENTDQIWIDGTSSYTDTRLCYDWAFENLKLVNIVDPSTIVTEVKLRYAAQKDNLLLYPDGELYAIIRKDDEAAHEVRYVYDELPESVKAPVKEGDIIGKAKVYYGDMYIGETNLIARDTVEIDGFVMVMDAISAVLSSTVAMVIYGVLLVVVLLYLYYVLVVVPKARKKQRRRIEQQRRQRGQRTRR